MKRNVDDFNLDTLHFGKDDMIKAMEDRLQKLTSLVHTGTLMKKEMYARMVIQDMETIFEAMVTQKELEEDIEQELKEMNDD